MNNFIASKVEVPTIGSPPIPIAVDIPNPALTTWSAASYVKVPDFETIPTFPFLKTKPGIIPTLASSGVIIPGQFGPIKVLFLFFNADLTLIISLTGIPSVIATTTSISESIDSKIASAAKAGGTKIIETLAPVFCFAS